MIIDKDPNLFRKRGRFTFRRLRKTRWHKHAIWKYILLLILVILLLRYLQSY